MLIDATKGLTRGKLRVAVVSTAKFLSISGSEGAGPPVRAQDEVESLQAGGFSGRAGFNVVNLLLGTAITGERPP